VREYNRIPALGKREEGRRMGGEGRRTTML